jgi:hypothetical protein
MQAPSEHTPPYSARPSFPDLQRLPTPLQDGTPAAWFLLAQWHRAEIQPPTPINVSIPAVAERSGSRRYCGWGLSPVHQWR